MNAHMIRIVEGPLPGDAFAANDPACDLPTARTRETKLALVPAPADSDPALDSNPENTAPAQTTEQDDYLLGGYAGI